MIGGVKAFILLLVVVVIDSAILATF